MTSSVHSPHSSPIRTTQVDIPPNMIDLGIGQPGFELLPLAIVRSASDHRLSQGNADFLNYGNEQGDGVFRRELAAFLSRGYNHPVSAEALFVTAGASQALDLICTLFTRPGDTIFVEEPSYFLALRIFADHHLRVVSIPIDQDGLIVDALIETLATERPCFLYTIPTFQNPTGITLSKNRRNQLVTLSQEYDFLIVADEVYHLLNYDTGATERAMSPPFAAYVNARKTSHKADGANVLSVGSFSKILAPGLRLGWIQGSTELVQQFVTCGMVDSGGGFNPLTSSIVGAVLELGLQDRYLAFLKETYSRRVTVLDEALQDQLRDTVTYRRPDGGFFFWLQLANGLDAERLLPVARQQNLGFQPGVRFSSNDALHDCLRLSFAFYDDQDLETGVTRLARAVAKTA
jgi:2-aminoadipate transaminase